uniref:HPt domain-containing protein n=1 Tax=Eutreptiella gymnastica TaxID=73025 RepID=A0A7S1IU02_9EUGL|mmetsp:Transcript_41504/g.74463  ORF Transcript_41504/g.74463 Transcript_41504/m.74463 type:complete len:240 (+) Transcript_41504:55-774(+)
MGCCDSKADAANGARDPPTNLNTSKEAPGNKSPTRKTTDHDFQLEVNDDVAPAANVANVARDAAKPVESPKVQPKLSKSEPSKRVVETDEKEKFDHGAVYETLVEELGLKNEQVIHVEQALEQTGQDYGFLIELMHAFQNQYAKHKSEIQKGLDTGNWETVALESHSLKGAAANLFIEQMKVVCFYCEKLGKAFRERCDKGETIRPSEVFRVEVALALLQDTFDAFEKGVDAIVATAPP